MRRAGSFCNSPRIKSTHSRDSSPATQPMRASPRVMLRRSAIGLAPANGGAPHTSSNRIHSDAPEVRLGVVLLVAQDLRRHVQGRAAQRLGQTARVHVPREAKVGDLERRGGIRRVLLEPSDAFSEAVPLLTSARTSVAGVRHSSRFCGFRSRCMRFRARISRRPPAICAANVRATGSATRRTSRRYCDRSPSAQPSTRNTVWLGSSFTMSSSAMMLRVRTSAARRSRTPASAGACGSDDAC